MSQTNTQKGKGGKVRRKQQRVVPQGVAYVKASFNNTLVSITDPTGQVLTWSSAGRVRFSGSRKSSAFAATQAAQDAAKQAIHNNGVREVEVALKGPGAGRESAVRGLVSAGMTVTTIKDRTPVAHNGCRPRKRRRN